MRRTSVNWKGIIWFVVIAYAFSCAIALWLYGRSPVLRKEAALA